MRENEAVISSWYFLSHRAAGNRRPRSLSLKVQKSAREIWSDALGKIWCKQAERKYKQVEIRNIKLENTTLPCQQQDWGKLMLTISNKTSVLLMKQPKKYHSTNTKMIHMQIPNMEIQKEVQNAR